MEDDGLSEEEFKEEMLGLSQELKQLQVESDKLMEDIFSNMQILGIGNKG